jgi:hypothetical protein
LFDEHRELASECPVLITPLGTRLNDPKGNADEEPGQ